MAIPNISNLPISASFQTILQISGSVIGTATGSQIDNLDISASYASNAGTANNANTATTATTAVSASHAVNADTASFALNVPTVDTGSLLLTASISDATITFEKADASTFDLTVNNVVSASHAISASHALFSEEAENAEHADAVQFPVIAKETLAKGDPVYVSGFNSGQDKPEVLKADASDSSKMPVVGLAMVAAVNNDPIFIAVGGNFSGVDTSTGLTNPQIGDTLYVASGGGYTNVKPTGTNLIQNIGVIGRVQQNTGQIVVSAIQRSNDLPNIAEDHLWLGDSNGVPQATDKDALTVGTASLALDVISSANLNVTSITASFATFNSASIGYLESITGSAKIIGDAFIVVNNDTPAERYAGLAVYDSGSANNTSSFAYDGLTDDWFFEKDVTGSAHFGVALFGPEYATKGAPAYITQDRIPKGVGDHHLEDSNISDDGSKIILGSDTEITGSLGVTGNITGIISTAISSSHALNADVAISSSHALQADTAISASHALIADNAPVINSLTYPTSDGTDGQAIVTDGLGVLTFQDIAGDPAGATDTGTTLSFDNAIGTIYNTAATGATGNITLSTTNAVVGAAAVIFHEDTAEPTVSGMTIDKKLGSYDTSALNVITFVHLGNNHVLQTIAGADITGIVTNSTDTYTTPVVQHIITLTAAEYAAIGTPDANTFYIVI